MAAHSPHCHTGQAEYNDKKKAYESAKLGHESRMSKLDGEVSGYKEELASAESQYHMVNCQLKLVDVSIWRVTQGGDSLNLRDKYQRRVKEAEDQHADLKVPPPPSPHHPARPRRPFAPLCGLL